MGLLFDQEVIYARCDANTMQKWVLSDKDAAPAEKREKRLSFDFDRLFNERA